ncbi:Rad52/Rad22 family DNA repair protein [Micromonospora andamanensis]|uniref:Rad52/22 family double-strand break repair protein n=1 Tax=Micromonospora andamanensis TaxID=1287068 RepID=A0ABQ4HZ21_9ACTN|nr:Rad52/Rad22 family DNA repair protein [Micromonospora andamanensis]GIJ10761.1 hypothetical protein Van01_39750 [Micromonospora andamanensis]
MTQQPRFQLTPEQYERLTMPLDTNRVGKNPKGFSHLEAWDVRRWLIRVFGFGSFDIETISLDLVKEIEHPARRRKDKKGTEYGDPYVPWTVVYRAQVRLTVYDQFGGKVVLEDGACGDSTNQPSLGDCHDNASKTALSQALKRCAVNLGDCFGLSLYNGGGAAPVVLRSLVAPEAEVSAAAAELPAEDAPVRPEPGTEPAPVDEQHHEPPAAPNERPVADPPAAEPRPAPTANGVRDWTLHPDRTASGIRQAATKLLAEHPAVAAARITNEHGDDEQLSVLMDRRAKELEPKAAQPTEYEERRRKRMFALLGDLGYREPEQYRDVLGKVLQRSVESSRDLTAADVEDVIAALVQRKRQLAGQGAPA